MATGENFKMIAGSRRESKLKIALDKAQETFTNYLKRQGEEEGWSFDEARRLEKKCERLEYLVWCEEYEDNRRRTWK